MQPTLGGLPPTLVMVGGGEVLRDEQIYLAHKMANPTKYPPADEFLDDHGRRQIEEYKPTDVQLQVWDDMCHVAPTLSFTRPAKYMYRSVAQFTAWALARAQKTGIDILDDDEISVISESVSDTEEADAAVAGLSPDPTTADGRHNTVDGSGDARIGKAGDPLPPFRNHMIRQRVTRKGHILPLDPPNHLAACRLSPQEVGTIQGRTARKWLEARSQWDARYATTKARVHDKLVRDLAQGYEIFDEGEFPPPTAMAGRRKMGDHVTADKKAKRRRKSYGLALWSFWGSKHDKAILQREQTAERPAEVKTAGESAAESEGSSTSEKISDKMVQATPLCSSRW